jgi:hypothetical protein
MTVIVHLAPFADARSGIGRYAERVAPLLATAAGTSIESIDTSHRPTSLRSMAAVTRETLARSRRGDAVIAEIGGRQISTLAAVGIAQLARRRVVLVVHDTPDLTGDPLALELLGSGRARHLAWLAGARAGRRLEQRVLHRATVGCLSDRGARALRLQWSLERPVHRLRYPVGTGPQASRSPVPRLHVLSGDLGSTVDVVRRALTSGPPPWEIAVSAADQSLLDALGAVVPAPHRVVPLDVSSRTAFAAALAESWLVMRLSGGGPPRRTHAWGAISGLAPEVAAAGTALLMDHPRSSAEYLDPSWATVVDDAETAAAQLGTLLADPAAVRTRCHAASAWAGTRPDEEVVERLRVLLADAAGPEPSPSRPRRPRERRHLRVLYVPAHGQPSLDWDPGVLLDAGFESAMGALPLQPEQLANVDLVCIERRAGTELLEDPAPSRPGLPVVTVDPTTCPHRTGAAAAAWLLRRLEPAVGLTEGGHR